MSENFPAPRAVAIEIEIISFYETVVDSRQFTFIDCALSRGFILGIKLCILRFYYYYYFRNVFHKRKGDHDRKSFRLLSRA